MGFKINIWIEMWRVGKASFREAIPTISFFRRRGEKGDIIQEIFGGDKLMGLEQRILYQKFS